ncbi:hypothetical protein FHS72_000737 [Loktanella ponticola]|uniref:Lipoprotein n=1 Tax=Yoonia ponticola TaxID=1524255 RepID=A0A7W9BIM3_9RHOB|nr:hypothetical protein [Yoonia ponticola]MBB5721130.1 hypothetical protein [Yoonia ponticola]
MFSITYKTLAALSFVSLASACASPIVISLPERPVEPGPVLAATQPFPAEVSAALPEGIPASAVKIQDGCYFYRFGDDIRPVSFDGTNPICPEA